MQVPISSFTAGISERKIYLFSSDSLNTSISHYFICIKRNADDTLILSCCTSQFEKREEFIKKRNLPYETLVYLPPTSENNLAKDTYVDCNGCIPHSVSDLVSRYKNETLKYIGEISIAHYEQILIGLHASPLVEREIKQQLPDPDDL